MGKMLEVASNVVAKREKGLAQPIIAQLKVGIGYWALLG